MIDVNFVGKFCDIREHLMGLLCDIFRGGSVGSVLDYVELVPLKVFFV